ncbi:Uncharacterized protein OBRU01_05410 [Operophtera brumata]|uniref:Uncharacterized protein n=1 Tax=Operophtera brumata TaxID=104452 RepID=A0A0L7LBX0_OPEBR|nr:Uncharacterized protein OBRU01_05410 [Operophtera brumata]
MFLERVTPRLAALYDENGDIARDAALYDELYDENGDIGNCTSIMFLECVTPRLAALYDENGDIVSLNIKIHKCGNSRTSQKPNCSCNMIDRADYIKYLGVVLDENLTFGQHIKTLSGRVRKLIHIMKLLRDGADRDVLKMVYTSLCQSVICYCLTSYLISLSSEYIYWLYCT